MRVRQSGEASLIITARGRRGCILLLIALVSIGIVQYRTFRLLWSATDRHDACSVHHDGQSQCQGNLPSLEQYLDTGETTAQLYSTQLTKALSKGGANNGTMVIVTAGGCECDLVSVDCIHSIRCLPHGRTAEKLIAFGVSTRRIMKEAAEWRDGPVNLGALMPLGKTLQYGTITAWEKWVTDNELPFSMGDRNYRFVNESLYPFCLERGLVGKACYFGNDTASDEDLGDLESIAIAREPTSRDSIGKIRADLVHFRVKSKLALQGHKRGQLPALGYLASFAHICRIRFNRQEPVRVLYSKYVASVFHVPPTDEERLRVGLHIRRADACGHKRTGFETSSANLSEAFPSSKRRCYATSVYVDALRRIQDEAGRMSLDVYLSTDDAGEILRELKNDFQGEWEAMNWHFLNFSRDVFDYRSSKGSSFIEFQSGHTQAYLGESAALDLWHLSHSRVFVGHLGSRFGKVAWLLATARHNAFVPFHSVDGHSFCCEVDESCEDMKPYISSMENCLTFTHDKAKVAGGVKINEDYWEVGSQMRRIVAEKRDAEKRDAEKLKERKLAAKRTIRIPKRF